MNFDDSLKRLNEIVNLMEKGNIDLDKALLLFEEGSDIIKNCNKLLDDAEQKVTIYKNNQEVEFDHE